MSASFLSPIFSLPVVIFCALASISQARSQMYQAELPTEEYNRKACLTAIPQVIRARQGNHPPAGQSVFQLFPLRAFQFHARIVPPVNTTMERLLPGAQAAGHSSGRNTMSVRISTALLVLTGLLCQSAFLRAEDKNAPAPAKVYGEWLIRPRPDNGTEYRKLIEEKGFPLV